MCVGGCQTGWYKTAVTKDPVWQCKGGNLVAMSPATDVQCDAAVCDLVTETSCSACAPGKYQDKQDQAKCKDCSRGQYSNAGQPLCTKCTSGR
jgi:hypothetical protein